MINLTTIASKSWRLDLISPASDYTGGSILQLDPNNLNQNFKNLI